ncbi:HelD family protein [Actinokineospora terrae]|uniref:DNA helicase IV n=1 Tax=Actinokineospora terrae TaxID=155974 RepID=A0A1H9ME72_9PSEU|nr:UvrD-helicase domain-containing protein [Actinokineospora terrae]SER21996.1 DNA helicase IV [Actinokineospora terrae]
MALWQAEVARLDSVEQGLCFGRLDMSDGTRVYVGRLGLFRDEDAEPLLVDWRVPVARAFYAATAAAPHGVRRRRHTTTRGRTVVALNDELLDLDGAGDRGLVGEAALQAAVTAERTGRMHDVVATLQAEQDRIIRHGSSGVLVVQGGPGTGKTAVALHRVAYLLHTRPHLRTRRVLVVGPCRIFLDHIGQVLPGLGENSVVTAAVADLWPGAAARRARRSEAEAFKGRAVMADRLAAAVRSRVRIPHDPVEVEFERQVLRLDQRTCGRAVREARRTGLPHNQARQAFQREIVDVLARRLVEDMEAVVLTDSGEAIDGGSQDGRLGESDLRAPAAAGVVLGQDDHDGPRTLLDETDLTGLRDSLLADTGLQAALDGVWPPLTAAQVVSDLVGEPAGGWSAADVLLLDEAAALVGRGEAAAVFGHVVVDEAQELSEMAWRMLMRRCPTRSMTIVGDLTQTGDPAGTSSWDRRQLARLTVNHRTPAEVMAATADLLAAHHPAAPPPRSVRSTGEVPWRVRTTRADLPRAVADLAATHTGGRLAIIAPSVHRGLLIAALSLPARRDLTDEVAPQVVARWAACPVPPSSSSRPQPRRRGRDRKVRGGSGRARGHQPLLGLRGVSLPSRLAGPRVRRRFARLLPASTRRPLRRVRVGRRRWRPGGRAGGRRRGCCPRRSRARRTRRRGRGHPGCSSGWCGWPRRC